MQKMIAIAMAFAGLCIVTQVPGQTLPLSGRGCADIVGKKWHNPWDVKVNLTITDDTCHFTLVMDVPRWVSLFKPIPSGIHRNAGKGYMSDDGQLVLPFKKDKLSGYFRLMRAPNALSGRVLISTEDLPITLNFVTNFPVDLR